MQLPSNTRSAIRSLETTHCDSLVQSVGEERPVGFTPAASAPRLAVRRNCYQHRWRSRLAMRLAVSCALGCRFL